MYINKNGEKFKNKEFVEVPNHLSGTEICYDVVVFDKKTMIPKGTETFSAYPTREQILYSIINHGGDSAEIRMIHCLNFK